MGLKLPGWVALLVSAIFGAVGYALPAEEHPLLKTGALVLAGLAFVALIIVLVVFFRRRGRSSAAHAPSNPRIRAKDSDEWNLSGIDAPGDQAFIEAENSNRWSIGDSRIGGDDAQEEGPPDAPREGGG